MKKITTLLTLCALAFSIHINAQHLGKLWGTTTAGTPNGPVLFAYDSLINADSVYTLPGSNGAFVPLTYNPVYSGFVLAPDGNYYGLCSSSNGQQEGGIIKITPQGIASTAYIFKNNYIDGNTPLGSLIVGADGNLYGMTSQGGAGFSGVIFEWNLTTSKDSVRDVFGSQPSDGGSPSGDLLLARNGTYYGMTPYYGGNQQGILFQFSPNYNFEQILYNFGSYPGDATAPTGSLIQASDGNLYGLAGGGPNNMGTIIQWDTLAQSLNIIYSFGNIPNDGQAPLGSLFQALDGNFYGVTSAGGDSGLGTLFEYNIQNSTYSILYSFGQVGGYGPQNIKLAQGKDSNLYGTVSSGGSYNAGAIFKWNTHTLTESTIYNFKGTAFKDGQNPQGSLIVGADSSLYGMTSNGGLQGVNSPIGLGTAFKYSTKKDNEKVLAYLGVDTVNFLMNSTPCQGKDGNIYAVTETGGTNGQGTIFQSNVKGTPKIIYNFGSKPNDGLFPYQGLIQASDSNFYGLTQYGGAYNQGAIIELNHATFNETVVYSFNSNLGDGTNPQGKLMEASDGNLYGACPLSGGYNQGTLFQWNMTNHTETVLYSFMGYVVDSDGANPEGAPVQALDGNLYGLTTSGGSLVNQFFGSIYKWDMTNQTETMVYGFGAGPNDGSAAQGSLVLGSDGNLYGMNQFSINTGNGTIFEWNVGQASYSVVHLFNGTDGSDPTGSLLLGSDGYYYGLAPQGGQYSKGTLFAFNATSQKDTVLLNFNGSDGAYPSASLLEAATIGAHVSCNSTTIIDAQLRGVNSASYLWSTNATTSSINVSTPGWYKVTAITPGGIVLKDSVDYTGTESLVSVSAPGITGTCIHSPGSLSATGSGGSSRLEYLWRPYDLTGATPIVQEDTLPTTYTVQAEDAFGCTATATELMKIYQPTTSDVSVTSCAFYNFNDTGLVHSGLYHQVIPNFHSCDSSITLHLTILQPSDTTITATACGSYHSNGAEYTSSGNYIQVINNKAGCDSTINLNLTINPLPDVTVSGSQVVPSGSTNAFVASGASSYTWSAGRASNDSDYVKLSNDTTITIIGLGANGCRDTTTFMVFVTGPASVNNIKGTGNNISAYPNPAASTVYLSFSMSGRQDATITLIDAMGREISKNSAEISDGKVMPVDVSSLAQGVYFVRIQTSTQTQMIKFIKE